MEGGVRRLLVDISDWNPSPNQFSSFIFLLPLHEQSSITRFVKMEDRKRAFISRLLQYVVVHQSLGIPYQEIVITRTAEGKPYLEDYPKKAEFPNFNFNSSHHGDYVGIASEPLCIVGLDIVSHTLPKQETTIEFLRSFSSSLTSLEWNMIINAGSSDEILGAFYRYWCLKEAYIKAIGAGLGFKLNRLEFHHTNWVDISVYIDGVESNDWKFWLSKLGKGHWAAIARGPPKEAIMNYKRTMPQADFEEKGYHEGLHLPNPGFTICTVEQLLGTAECSLALRHEYKDKLGRCI